MSLSGSVRSVALDLPVPTSLLPGVLSLGMLLLLPIWGSRDRVVSAEVFPLDMRAKGMSISSAVK